MDKVFLDANVLFSAAYRQDSRLTDLWSLDQVELVTSRLALEEARRNLAAHRPSALLRLEELCNVITIINISESSLPDEIDIADKDAPILAAALHAQCSHLVTGDCQHFGVFFGTSVHGVLVLTPAQYLNSRKSTQ
ncbi:MAG: PIN domain-containing protein [Armatimonadota bacterium]